MRSFLRSLFNQPVKAKRPRHARRFHHSTIMSSASTSAALYAAAISTTSQTASPVPEESSELRHHVKGGKGFVNPWDSYNDRTAFQIVKALIL